jgi:predicted  nucleic acid-binding Zn-ribbon protein
MTTSVSQLEASEQKARSTIDALRFEISQYQSHENELYRKIDRLKDELVDTYKDRHSRSPSNSSRGTDRDEESSSKRRKVLLSELVDVPSHSIQSSDLEPIATQETQPIEPVALATPA